MDMQDSDEFVVGVRNDYNLHCYKLTAGSADVVWQMQYNYIVNKVYCVRIECLASFTVRLLHGSYSVNKLIPDKHTLRNKRL